MTQERKSSDAEHEHVAEELTQTTPTGQGVPQASDVESDPALSDKLGADWNDEGGAAPGGPATATAPPREGGAGSA